MSKAVEFPNWSAYNYAFDNPIVFIDKDGKDGTPFSQAFLDGANDALYSNTIQLGFGREVAAELYPNDLQSQKDFIQGQIFGDLVSLGIGAIEITMGATGAIGSLEVTVASGGTASPLSVPALVASGLIVLTGTVTTINAASGLVEANKQLKAVNKKISGKNGKHANQKAKQTASEKYEVAKKELDNLRTTPNKNPELKTKIKKMESQVKQLKQKADFSGENHSQRSKGSK